MLRNVIAVLVALLSLSFTSQAQTSGTVLDRTDSGRYLVDTGPLRIRDQFPLSMGFLSFEPVNATVLPSGDWQFDFVTTVTNTWATSDALEGLLEDRTSRQDFTFADLQAADVADPALASFCWMLKP